ncbi:Undecaprenyl phosphate N,N'-diacetylbacillosamine 1-phosphate transferase [Botrimarina colliarenosi]|uniref:Undecaprenyl phosphate N,N'-diacetylbacillosamine 1-phosphate transferase n=1 Tax=Botrimarina colliarenosi TaxID=2528001 RepID=A0A5C6AC72_9BACT|nr:sugar transferase [Botrimarina colliarenosi]TWT97614.1 Undecaprenyl phosphate N,N'-diacetylbacillosamine 1-phosphate transferase [Botrimarina colliarenosi]
MHRENLGSSRDVSPVDLGLLTATRREAVGSIRRLAAEDARLGLERERRRVLFVSAPSQSPRLRYANYFYHATSPTQNASPVIGGREFGDSSTVLRSLLFPGMLPDGDAIALETPAQRVALADSVWYEFAKRAMDFLLSLALIVLISPVLLAAALAIKLTSRGPAIYAHKRVGKDGEQFTCLKFRTMVVDAEDRKAEIAHLNVHSDSRTFKIPNDPRVTRIGFWMRRLSIDELPQLFNVLVGDMSLVGPRPPLPSEVRLYSRHDWLRMQVKPGITCIWQVSGRSRLAFPEQVELDIEYIETRSLLLDLKLLVKTVPAVLGLDGAY